MKGLKLPCSMRRLSWGSAIQKCPDELSLGPLSVRITGETFGTTIDIRVSSLEKNFSSLRPLLGILITPVLLIEAVEILSESLYGSTVADLLLNFVVALSSGCWAIMFCNN